MLPHLIWEQSATYTLAAICIRTCRLFEKSSRNICLRKLCEIPPRIWCRNTLMLSSRPPVAAVGSCTMPDLMDEAVVQGHGAQNNYYSVKWNWMGSVASEPNVESAVGSTERVRNRNSVQLSRAVSGSFRGQSLCLLNLPEERGFIGPVEAGSIWQTGVPTLHKHSESSRSHWCKHLLMYRAAACEDKTKTFAHLSVDAVEKVWGYCCLPVLLHVSLVTKTWFCQSAKSQINI